MVFKAAPIKGSHLSLLLCSKGKVNAYFACRVAFQPYYAVDFVSCARSFPMILSTDFFHGLMAATMVKSESNGFEF
jgi:hypothetical protein